MQMPVKAALTVFLCNLGEARQFCLSERVNKHIMFQSPLTCQITSLILSFAAIKIYLCMCEKVLCTQTGLAHVKCFETVEIFCV